MLPITSHSRPGLNRRFAALALALLTASSLPAAEAPSRWGDWPAWGDQKDGTYRNPVLPGDYSDIDCIRVGSDYYAISSTFQYSPGMVILRSKDLVNWSIVGHAVDDVSQIGPNLNWDRMNRYGRGIWAGAIRYRAGKFWIYFGTPEEGYFMTTAKDPAGPWEPLHQMTKEGGWDDCCPFWDDDGQGYFVATHFKDGYKTWLYKLTADGRDLVPEPRVLINEGAGREANKLYKINGTYYHLYSEVGPGGRRVMMQRAKRITGPYTEKRQLNHPQAEFNEPNQGGIVQTEKGDWYFLTHHGHGEWEGRPASLLPVQWVGGWPILGKVGDDGIGLMVWRGAKPVKNTPVVVPQSSEDFNGPKLGLQWEWNYQPRKDMWSLTERPGWLRLHAGSRSARTSSRPPETRSRSARCAPPTASPRSRSTSPAWPTARSPASAITRKTPPRWACAAREASTPSNARKTENPPPARASPRNASGSAPLGDSMDSVATPTAPTAKRSPPSASPISSLGANTAATASAFSPTTTNPKRGTWTVTLSPTTTLHPLLANP